jgi:plastocyanin
MTLESGCNGMAKRMDLGNDITALDHGTRSVVGKKESSLDAGSFYFSPTVLQGRPGQAITLRIRNTSPIEHDFTSNQGPSTALPAKATAAVQVTFPPSGTVLFVCMLHRYNGMAGQIVVAGN